MSRICFVNCGLPNEQCACWRKVFDGITQRTNTGIGDPDDIQWNEYWERRPVERRV